MTAMTAIDRRHNDSIHAGPAPAAVADTARSSGPSADSGDFINAMRYAVTGVNIVTTDGPAGRFGLTVSAFSSVSAEPPMLLVCINRRSPACAAIRSNRRFCVNVLAAAQRPLADSFAGRPRSGRPYDFAEGQWQWRTTGSPVLADAVASFDCTLHESAVAGTHRIFIGAAVAIGASPGTPLLYTNRAYGRPGHSDQ